MTWSSEFRERIREALDARKVVQPCPRCGNNQFVLLDGYINQPLSPTPTSMTLGGQTIPSIVVACNRCGFLATHALLALGITIEEAESLKPTNVVSEGVAASG